MKENSNNDHLGVPGSEQPVGPSATSPQAITPSGLSATVPDAPAHRPLKFRIWFVGNQFAKPQMIHDNIQDFLPKPTGIECWIGGVHSPIMQFTGLKDKNGRDIYEGDVLLVPHDDNPGAGDPAQLVTVQYDGPWLVYVTVNHGTHWSVADIIGYRTDQDDDAEVIGNIYENPELLA